MPHVPSNQIEVEARVALARSEHQCLAGHAADNAQPLEVGLEKLADGDIDSRGAGTISQPHVVRDVNVVASLRIKRRSVAMRCDATAM